MQLNDTNFLQYAMHNYDNVQCVSIEEFQEDLQRFIYLSKLFNRYNETGELRERLILNHLIVLYNVFGNSTTDMLYFKLDLSHFPALNTFLVYLNRIESSDIDFYIADKLRQI